MNEIIFNAIHGLSGQSAVLDFLAIFFAKYVIFLMFAFVLGWLWRRDAKAGHRAAVKMFLAAIAAWVGHYALKHVIVHARPFTALHFSPLISQEPSNSFPSGHTALVFGLAFAFLFWACQTKNNGLEKVVGWLLLLVALLVGVSRIYVGVHWPLDILGGIALGAISGWLLTRPFTLLEKDKVQE